MNDIKISDMMNMQKELWEQHRDTWSPLEPEFGRNSILYMIEEVGECIAIIKKKGDAAIAGDADVRAHFVEEMNDVLMYFTDALLRYGISPEELSDSYIQKHQINMGRDFTGEHKKQYTK